MSESISKLGHGGARPNSGGARPGAGRPWRVHHEQLVRRESNSAEWYCVRTRYEDETLAAIEIGLAGFDLFAPTIWQPPTRRRRDAFGVLRPARPGRIKPLFPRYQFVRFRMGDDWQEIRKLPGVDGILGTTPDTPAPMPVWAIEQIRAMCSENGCLYPEDAPGALPGSLVGTLVRLIDGPMTSFEGLCNWSDGQRVRVLLSLFGRPCPVEVDLAAVEAV